MKKVAERLNVSCFFYKYYVTLQDEKGKVMEYFDITSMEDVFSSQASESQEVHNHEMNVAWQFVTSTNVSVFLTGKAGTGKTTFLRTLRERTPKRMVVLAPTGVAAINAQGQTIHSFFQLLLHV